VPPTPDRPFLVLGLLGGVGSGKSTVAGLLAEAGAVVLDADRRAREALDDPQVRNEVLAAFGPSVQGPGGSLDRVALAARVFGPDSGDRRRTLESILHPRVREALEADLERLRGQTPPPRLVVLDVPLLAEGPLEAWCDVLVFVDAPREVREERCRRRRGWDAGEIARREAAQLDLAEKRARAHHVLGNAADLGELRARTEALLARVLTGPALSDRPRSG
jgi:dephospho-CoA kinase